MESVLREVASEMAGKAIVGKVYPSERELFRKFGVRGVPTLFVVRNGVVKRFVGRRSSERLIKALKQNDPAS